MGDLRLSFPQPCGEKWEEMRQRDGCNRQCSRCATTVHDLAQLTLEEAERLLSSGDKICVRAEMDATGAIALRSDRGRSARRMVAVMGASMGLFAMSAAAIAGAPIGAIAGNVKFNGYRNGVVTATGRDGIEHRVKTHDNGQYEIRDLPPGTYELLFTSLGGDWVGRQIVVQSGKTATLNLDNRPREVIIGMVTIVPDEG